MEFLAIVPWFGISVYENPPENLANAKTPLKDNA